MVIELQQGAGAKDKSAWAFRGAGFFEGALASSLISTLAGLTLVGLMGEMGK